MEKQGAGITVTQHILKQQRENPEATGAFTTLLNELDRREARYGIATMCIGQGQAIAAVIERL